MRTATMKESIQENSNNQTSFLIDAISEWPDWKIKSLCMDQSDIALLQNLGIINNL